MIFYRKTGRDTINKEIYCIRLQNQSLRSDKPEKWIVSQNSFLRRISGSLNLKPLFCNPNLKYLKFISSQSTSCLFYNHHLHFAIRQLAIKPFVWRAVLFFVLYFWKREGDKNGITCLIKKVKLFKFPIWCFKHLMMCLFNSLSFTSISFSPINMQLFLWTRNNNFFAP